MGGMTSQNVLNVVDSAMVSRLPASETALAAVGYGGFSIFVSQALLLGFSTSVQASASRRKGEGRGGEAAKFLNAALLIIALVAPLFVVVLFFRAPSIFPYLSDDVAVIDQAVVYYQIRLFGIAFLAMNFAFRGYWNAMDLARYYLTTLVLMHATNIFLNYVFIFGNLGAPALGTAGAGLATAISLAVGSGIYTIIALRNARDHGFLAGLPPRQDIKTLIKLTIPSGFQNLFFAAGFLCMLWIIGQIGTAEAASAHVLVNLTLVALLPGMGLGLAAATLVGQALGRRDPDDAEAWGYDVVKVSLVVVGLLGLPFAIAPEAILTTVYTLSPDVLNVTTWPLRIVGLSIALDAAGMVFMNSLLGAGDARRVMVVAALFQWLVFLPGAFLIGPVMGWGILGIWVLQGVYRGLQAIVFFNFWRGRRWAAIKI